MIKTFSEINKTSVAEAGGKGASLGEMTRSRLPVPPGFVILAAAFDRFLKETGLGAEVENALKKIKPKNDIHLTDEVSVQIRSMMTDVKMPADLEQAIKAEFKKLKTKYVAVRSSATAEDSKVASWAGELETYLNVTDKNLIQSVRKCWSSLFTPRAIFYRFEKKLHKKPVSVAVVVQEMVQSEISGIAFTVHPVTKDRDQMIVEAGFGLGEAIVGGLVTPDSYIVHKTDLAIIDIAVSEQKMMIIRTPKGNVQKNLKAKNGGKQKLTGKQITEIAKICRQIEKHYKHPQDIEWAFAKGKFYITQSRPITTL